jgi:hypothetical protein
MDRELAMPDAASLFEDVQITTMPVHTDQAGDELNAYMRTTSLYARIAPDRREELEAENQRSQSDSEDFYSGANSLYLSQHSDPPNPAPTCAERWPNAAASRRRGLDVGGWWARWAVGIGGS